MVIEVFTPQIVGEYSDSLVLGIGDIDIFLGHVNTARCIQGNTRRGRNSFVKFGVFPDVFELFVQNDNPVFGLVQQIYSSSEIRALKDEDVFQQTEFHRIVFVV